MNTPFDKELSDFFDPDAVDEGVHYRWKQTVEHDQADPLTAVYLNVWDARSGVNHKTGHVIDGNDSQLCGTGRKAFPSALCTCYSKHRHQNT